jgi:hypothetical protein
MLDIPTLQSFFMWCTILNFGILILTSLILTIGGDFAYWVQSKFFNIPRQTFDVAVYCWIGFFKIIVIVFSFVPWMVLLIIG